MKRTSVAALAAVLVLSTPVLTGCFSGQGATTTTQATMNSGNGVEAEAGDIDIEDATLVLGPEGSKSATLIMTLVATGEQPDTLAFATINGVPAYITPGAGDVVPGTAARFGYVGAEAWVNAYDLDVPSSSYVPVELNFANAGNVKLSVLTVPAAGFYAGIAPEPATAPVG